MEQVIVVIDQAMSVCRDDEHVAVACVQCLNSVARTVEVRQCAASLATVVWLRMCMVMFGATDFGVTVCVCGYVWLLHTSVCVPATRMIACQGLRAIVDHQELSVIVEQLSHAVESRRFQSARKALDDIVSLTTQLFDHIAVDDNGVVAVSTMLAACQQVDGACDSKRLAAALAEIVALESGPYVLWVVLTQYVPRLFPFRWQPACVWCVCVVLL